MIDVHSRNWLLRLNPMYKQTWCCNRPCTQATGYHEHFNTDWILAHDLVNTKLPVINITELQVRNDSP